MSDCAHLSIYIVKLKHSTGRTRRKTYFWLDGGLKSNRRSSLLTSKSSTAHPCLLHVSFSYFYLFYRRLPGSCVPCKLQYCNSLRCRHQHCHLKVALTTALAWCSPHGRKALTDRESVSVHIKGVAMFARYVLSNVIPNIFYLLVVTLYQHSCCLIQNQARVSGTFSYILQRSLVHAFISALLLGACYGLLCTNTRWHYAYSPKSLVQHLCFMLLFT